MSGQDCHGQGSPLSPKPCASNTEEKGIESSPISLDLYGNGIMDMSGTGTSLEDTHSYHDMDLSTQPNAYWVDVSERLNVFTPSDAILYQDTDLFDRESLSPKLDQSAVYDPLRDFFDQPSTVIQDFPTISPPTSQMQSSVKDTRICSLTSGQSPLNLLNSQTREYIDSDTIHHEHVIGVPNMSNSDLPNSFGSKDMNQKDCPCLDTVLILTKNLEPEINPNKVLAKHELGAALDRHKRAVRHGESLVRCRTCSKLPRSRSVLELLVDRLLLFCEKIIVSYLTGDACQGERNSVLEGFNIDANMEVDLLLGSLTALQLQSLMSFFEQVKGVEGLVGPEVDASESRMQTMRQLLELRWPNRVLKD
ncbi:hypothetical protein F4808DRAFT_476352 [Astrocystis sublimbata]|nr:hypothetical protein F4808DRAFT_476352 [Astrocystis sublimbata]